jgi:RNA polymerase sigma factor (TIGR02999 family)
MSDNWRVPSRTEKGISLADLTQILTAAAGGDRTANARLFAIVYDDLRQLAAAKMAGERPGHTLQATALVNEVYIKLVANAQPHWENRHHFYAAAGEAMRRILVDSARRRKRLKRGGQGMREPLPSDVADDKQPADPADVLAVDDALEKLRQFDPRLCDIINLRVFVGMTIAETAQALGVTSRTVNREWAVAKAWLSKNLGIDGETYNSTPFPPEDVAD